MFTLTIIINVCNVLMRCSSKLHILRRAKSTCLHACTVNFALLGMFTDWQVQCCYMAVLSTGLKLDLYIYIVFLNLAGPVCIRLGARIEVRTPGSCRPCAAILEI